jgi:DNA-binding NtrC family response regulator
MEAERRILLVDDDVDALELVGEFLASEGFAVETAADGLSALDKLRGFAADVVVTDLEMPGMTGLELIELIHMRQPERPTLLVTGHGDSRVLETASPNGSPMAYLTKPVNLDELVHTVCRLIAASSTGANAASGGVVAH